MDENKFICETAGIRIDKYISERKFWSSFDDEVEELREDIRKAKKYDKRNPLGKTW